MRRARHRWSLAYALAVSEFAAGRSDAEMGVVVGCGPRWFARARAGFAAPGVWYHRWPERLTPQRFFWHRTRVPPPTAAMIRDAQASQLLFREMLATSTIE